jgi:hypothetical protein
VRSIEKWLGDIDQLRGCFEHYNEHSGSIYCWCLLKKDSDPWSSSVNLKDMWCEDIGWIDLVQSKVQWRAPMNIGAQ